MDKTAEHPGRQQYRLPWPPSLNGYWRNVAGRTLISKAGRLYRIQVYRHLIAQGYLKNGIARIALVLHVNPPDARRRDLDNLTKALLDAMEAARLFDNDSQIDDLRLIRGAPTPGGLVTADVWRLAMNKGMIEV